MPILNGWKEIACYMGRGVRTAQRWEGIGLPVRRPRGKTRSVVIAVPEEVDAWLHCAPTHEIPDVKLLKQRIAELQSLLRSL